MDAEKFAQEMLEADSAIRYVAVVRNYRILASKQREGVPSLTSDEMQRNFVSIIPQIITESVNKLSPFLGDVEGATAHYAKALLVFYQFEDMIVSISFQPEVATPFYNRITEAFKKNGVKYLT
jgi:hypothetical protein